MTPQAHTEKAAKGLGVDTAPGDSLLWSLPSAHVSATGSET